MAATPSPRQARTHDAPFDTTQWSVVLAAGHDHSAVGAAALESLCRKYWYPLYAYARRRVQDEAEAQDLTQEYFTAMLEKNYLADVLPERGRFRSFLLTSFQHFLSKQWDKARTQKRGGGRRILTLDFSGTATDWQTEPIDGWSPERLFEREWAVTLTRSVFRRLDQECTAAGKKKQFSVLKSYLAGAKQGQNYQQAAGLLQLSPGAVRVAVHRLRRRYGELLREEIRHTVDRPDDVDDEIRALFAALG